MSSDESKAVVRRYYELYNQGDIEGLRELISPNYVCHIGGASEPVRGLDANIEMEAYLRNSFSDIRMNVQELFAEGETVAARRTWSMRHTGDYSGNPATGRELSGTAVDIFHVKDGKLVESWTESDNLSFMQQLEAIPTIEEAVSR